MTIRERIEWLTDTRRRTLPYGIVLRIVPGDAALLVEIEQAPDSAGAPDTGNAHSLGTVGPFARQGGIFFARVRNDSATYWYRVRHVGINLNPGSWTSWKSGVPGYVDPATLEALISGGVASAHPIIRSIPLDDGDYAVSAGTSDGLKVRATVLDSRDLAINTMFGKTADDLDDANDGATYGKTRNTGLTGGEIDLSKSGVINRHSSNIVRSGGDATALSTIVNRIDNAGNAAGTMNDDRGVPLNTTFAKLVDDLDDASDGASFRKVTGVNVSNQVTPSSTIGRNRSKITHSTTQSIATATDTILAFNSEFYDPNSLHDAAINNSRITIPTGGDVGVWIFTAQVSFDLNATGVRRVKILKNGTTILGQTSVPAVSGFTTVVPVTAFDDAPSVGDYYEVQVLQNSGGALNVTGGVPPASDTFFATTHLW